MIKLTIANSNDRTLINKIRYSIYCKELKQYPTNKFQSITNNYDKYNNFIVAKSENEILGFICITPQNPLGLSLERHLKSNGYNFKGSSKAFELRLFTIIKKSRGSVIGFSLLIASRLLIERQGGNTILALGKDSLLHFYEKFYFKSTGIKLMIGNVSYQLIQSDLKKTSKVFYKHKRVIHRLRREINWGVFASALEESIKKYENIGII